MHAEKMSAFCLSMMLMKKHELRPSLHHVDEKKACYRFGGFRMPGDVAGGRAQAGSALRTGRQNSSFSSAQDQETTCGTLLHASSPTASTGHIFANF
jgi:hypothetical protein